MEEDAAHETHEMREHLEELSEHRGDWRRFLAITTALIAVCAAIASLLSGNYANEGMLEKDNAILLANKAADQWNYYQAKGIKQMLAQSRFEQTANAALKSDVDRYGQEQLDIQKQAQEYEKGVDEANGQAEALFARHHKMAFSVTFFQIAIAMSAISALLARRLFWFFSLVLALAGLAFMALGLA
jgi:hypothetical protein